MAKRRQIKLDTRTFDKAGDATAFFRAMLGRYSIGDRVTEEDALDLTALIKRHDEVDEKIGVGVQHFAVLAAPAPYSGKCFWIVRTNESVIDISYQHCLEPRPHDN